LRFDGEWQSISIAGHEARRRCQCAAARDTKDDDCLRIDLQLRRILRYPDKSSIAVFGGAGRTSFRRKAVLDRYYHAVDAFKEIDHLCQACEPVPADHSTTMDVV
jgi:hypothetical protein